MKAISKIMLLMAALTTAWGCSSDDEEMNGSNATFSAGEKPCWTVNLTGHEGRPDWTMPDPAGYESDMFLLVRLQDELAASSSDDDCMAVLIDGECRGLTQVRNTADECRPAGTAHPELLQCTVETAVYPARHRRFRAGAHPRLRQRLCAASARRLCQISRATTAHGDTQTLNFIEHHA